MALFTVIFHDGNDVQYSYVDVPDVEQITIEDLVNGVQNGELYEDFAEDVEGQDLNEGVITCIIPDHVAVIFP